jgi:DNA-binding transcriptional regulator LsrR (DeoR family)
MQAKEAIKSRALYRPKRHYRDMNRQKADQIRIEYFSTRCKQKDLAIKYNVSQVTICRIISGQVW